MRRRIVGIYLIQIGKYNYVGQSINIKTRISQHKYDLKNNIHGNGFMQNVYNKYKCFSYKILWTGEKSNLQLIEQMYIDWFSNSMNIKKASSNKMTETHKNNISKAHKNSKLVKASLERARKAQKENGYFLSEEQKDINRSKLVFPKKETYNSTTKFCFHKKGKECFVGTSYEFALYSGIYIGYINDLLVNRRSNSNGWHFYAMASKKPG